MLTFGPSLAEVLLNHTPLNDLGLLDVTLC